MKKTAAICFLLRFFGLAAISKQMCVQQQNGFLKFVNTTQGDFIWSIETMRYCRFDQRGPRMPTNTLVDKMRSCTP